MRHIPSYRELIPFTAMDLIQELHNSKYEAYLVGGCVRDMTIGIEPHDWDICTNAKPDEIVDVLKRNGFKIHLTGVQYGTVNVIVGGSEYEITTYRADTGYTDGRHPDAVKYVSDIHEDLKRRDFTINAMAYDPINDVLIDDFGGQKDLENYIKGYGRGQIKTVGNPVDRFNEDSLRILRALRFAIKFGFDIESETLQAMREHAKSLDRVSKERITEELYKILTCGKPITPWFMICSSIIKEIIPELEKCFKFEQNNKYHKHDVYEHILNVVDNCKSNKFEIKLAALLHDIGKPDTYVVGDDGYGHFYGHPEVSCEIAKNILDKHLRLTVEQSTRVLDLVKYHDITIANTKASVKRAMNKHGIDMLEDWFILKQADIDDHIFPDNKWKHSLDVPRIKELMQIIIVEQSCFSLKELNINGNILIKELGIKPGKQIGKILHSLLEEVIDEKIDNDTDVLIRRARELNEVD